MEKQIPEKVDKFCQKVVIMAAEEFENNPEYYYLSLILLGYFARFEIVRENIPEFDKHVKDTILIKNANEIINEVRSSISNWENYAKELGVTKSSINKIKKVLDGIDK